MEEIDCVFVSEIFFFDFIVGYKQYIRVYLDNIYLFDDDNRDMENLNMNFLIVDFIEILCLWQEFLLEFFLDGDFDFDNGSSVVQYQFRLLINNDRNS